MPPISADHVRRLRHGEGLALQRALPDAALRFVRRADKETG